MQKYDSHKRARKFGLSTYSGKYTAKKTDQIVRTLCMILACVMTMTLLVSGIAYQGVWADTATSGQCGEEMWWKFDVSTGILTIEGQGAMWDFEKSEEAPWAGFTTSIHKIVFLSGVTVIGKNAFVNCSVETVAFPDTLTIIRENAFLNCGKLVELDASQTQLNSVEAKAFSGCRALRMEAVSMPDSIIFVDETAFDTEPSEEPAEPSEEPTEPSEEPTEPSEEPTEPSEEPTEPSEEPTEPSEESTEPSEEPTEPSEEPTEPSEEPTGPSEEPTEPSEEPMEPSKKPYSIKEYNINGNLVVENFYNANGDLVGENHYDPNGGLFLSYQYDATTGATINYYYVFDSDNSAYEGEYDEEGRLIKVTYSYDGIGDTRNYQVEEYKYNDEGKIAEWSYNSMGAGQVNVKYVYDADGNLVEQRFYAPDDRYTETTNPDGSFKIYKYEREYDEAGNLICYEVNHIYPDGNFIPAQKNEFYYDEAGNLVEAVISEPIANESVSYKYEFDDEGKQTGYSYFDSNGNLTGYGVIEFETVSTEEPTEETEEPTEETEEPTEETEEPTEESTEETEEPTEGTEESTEETEEPTEETEESTEETEEPSEETEEPTEETEEPTEETEEPTEETEEPTEETTESTEETTESTEENAEYTEEAA